MKCRQQFGLFCNASLCVPENGSFFSCKNHNRYLCRGTGSSWTTQGRRDAALALLLLNYHCSWNKPTQIQAPGSPGEIKLFPGINKNGDDEDCLFNTHRGGMEICHLWVLLWGWQRLFPCVTFITRSVRLHPVCIRLVWHWILILMEKDYVIFTGTQIDYPFWPGWKVARVPFCRCWLGAERSPESRPRITKLGQQLWLLNFLFTFHSFLLFKRVALRTHPSEQGQWHGWKWCRLWEVSLLTSSLKHRVKIPEGTFGITSHFKRCSSVSGCPFLHWSFVQYFDK